MVCVRGALAGTSIKSLLDQLIAHILDLMKTLFTLSDALFSFVSVLITSMEFFVVSR